ncbi:MAG: acetylserotonin O-methyltransferase [Acidobacteria bacterium]|nr:acetylserotonin O-methyltransferase [Acidobacteriota bacterium]
MHAPALDTGRALAPDPIMQLGFAFWGSKVLLTAVELKLFTELAKSPLGLEEATSRLGLHRRSAADFLDALVSLGLLDRDHGRYSNTALADTYLDEAKPSYIGGILEMLNRRLYTAWGSLKDALVTGKPQNESPDGGELFAALYGDPVLLRSFLSAMTGLSLPLGRAMAARFPWSDYHSFADIGAAQGGLARELALAHLHLTGVGFDLPQVRPVFEEYIAAPGVDGRLRFQPGDFFKDPLPSTDVLIMGHILHDWDLETKRMLLGKAHAALPKGGVLIVYDTMIDDERRQNTLGLLMSLNMLIETPGGFDYTGADCVKWMRQAGFRSARVEPLTGAHSMAIATK